MRGRTALAVTALVATACGGAGGTGGAEGTTGPDGDWVLTAGTQDGDSVPIVPNHEITLSVDGQRWNGTAACNSYGATVAVDGDRVTIEGVDVTEMACLDDEAMASEAAYLSAFTAVDRFTEEDGRLTLAGERVELVYDAAPTEEDAPVAGTEWRIDGLVEGDGPDASVSSVLGDPGLLLEEDGTARAHTGCRGVEASWTHDEGSGVLSLTDLAVEETACDEGEAAQDEHVLQVLGGDVQVALEGRSLRLTAPDGAALDLRAP